MDWCAANHRVPVSLDVFDARVSAISPGPAAPPPHQSPAVETDRAQHLVAALRHSRIEGRVVDVQPGPVVTVFSVELAPEVSTDKAVKCVVDVARRMKVKSVAARSETDRGVVCYDVANERRETVLLRDLMASDAWRGAETSDMALPMAIGCHVNGAPCVVDLADMPHMLIAGATKSGKSVGLNAMILSLLSRHGPDALRMIMIDPKFVELSMYADIPHLLTPVVVESRLAIVALTWAIGEMERRYRLLHKAGTRNIASYTAKAARFNAAGPAAPMEAMPYIVVIIDEVADLMAVAGDEVDEAIDRLAAKARAAGIHLILATQRPSVDVITGTIKANMPHRLAFRTVQKEDSKTILGCYGAEQLLGRGDALYSANGVMTRVHGAFASDEEVECAAEAARALGAPVYLDELTCAPAVHGADDGDAESWQSSAPPGGGVKQKQQKALDRYVAFLRTWLASDDTNRSRTGVIAGARASRLTSLEMLYKARDRLGVVIDPDTKIWRLPDEPQPRDDHD